MIQLLQPLLGLALLVGIAWALSEKRREVDWRILPVSIGLQLCLALLTLKVPFVQSFLGLFNQAILTLVQAVEAGTAFVFGFLGGANDPAANPYPFEVSEPAGTYIFAFRVLPIILVMTVLSSVFWYFRLLQPVVFGFSWLLRHSLRVGGAVGLSTAANVFLGQAEAPTLIRPYLARLSRSELLIVITGGMATVSGSIMVFYAFILQDVLDNAIGHMLTASVISAPAAILMARIMIPDRNRTVHADEPEEMRYVGLMDAITRGTVDGTRIMVNIGAMLIVLLSLVALVNSALGVLPHLAGAPVTLERIFGYLFAPLVLMMGVPLSESLTAGSLMGVKTVLNEVISYQEMARLPPGELSERSTIIMTYAMCGFANFGSVGIMIGAMSGLCPERNKDTVQLAPRAMIAATLATSMTGAVVALLL